MVQNSNIWFINGLHMHQNFILKLFGHHSHIQSVQDLVLIVIYFVVLLLWVIEFGRIFEFHKIPWINQNWLIILQDRSKIYISICCQAFWVVKSLFDNKFCGLEHSKSDCFSWQSIPKSTFGFPCKDICCLLYNANIVKDISDLQQKYVKVKSLRRSGWISNLLLYKTCGEICHFFSEHSL